MVKKVEIFNVRAISKSKQKLSCKIYSIDVEHLNVEFNKFLSSYEDGSYMAYDYKIYEYKKVKDSNFIKVYYRKF